MSKVVDILQADDQRDVIHRVVQHLAKGELVALPCETSTLVVAQANLAEGVNRLQALAGENPPVMLLKGSEEVRDYVPGLSEPGERLSRRCWPGPVVMSVSTVGDEEVGLLKALPEPVRHWLTPTGEIRFRVPQHPILREALSLTPAPLITWDEDTETPLTTEQVETRFENDLSIIVSAGQPRYDLPSTLVRVATGQDWTIQRAGVVNEQSLQRLMAWVVIFVCTGNTCRSPMAEALFRQMLADRLEVPPEDLIHHGYMVLSAGLAAYPGSPASPESVELMRRRGIDLDNHNSQPLTDHLMEQADLLLTMTPNHRDAIVSPPPGH